MNDTLVLLEKQYPEITEVLSSESFKKFVDSRLYIYKLRRTYDAEDIINDVYEQFDRSVKTERYKEMGKLSAWCRQTAVYIILNLSKKEKLRGVAIELDTLDKIKPCPPKDTVYEDTKTTLCQVLKQLDKVDAEILKLHYIEDREYQEVLTILRSQGVMISSVDAMRKRVQRAKEKLRKLYAQKISQL